MVVIVVVKPTIDTSLRVFSTITHSSKLAMPPAYNYKPIGQVIHQIINWFWNFHL